MGISPRKQQGFAIVEAVMVAVIVATLALIITLIVNPEGIAGTGWKKQQQKKRRQASGTAPPGLGTRLARLRAPATTAAGEEGKR